MATIRPADPADVPAVLALWAANRSPAASAADSDDAIATLTAHDPGALLLAEGDGGELVGAIVVGWDGWRGGIYRLAVVPAARRAGVGTALVRAAEDALVRKGCRRVGLLTGVEEEGAIAFWEALGYEPDRRLVRLAKNL